MTAFVFFIFKSAGEEEGWFEGDSTWLNPIFNTKVVVRASPFFAVSTVLHVIISKQDIQIC
jgi:hypothetical protein